MVAGQLSDREVRIVNLIEQRFFETGRLPTNEKIAEDLNINKQIAIAAWKKDTFRIALAARGVDLTPEESEDLLTPEQLIVANMVMNIHDKSSIRQKLKDVSTALGKNITVQRYNGWMTQPAFVNYLKKRAEKQFGAADSAALLTHVKAIHDGDMNAVKLYYEMNGRYNPRLQVDINIESVIIQVVEIISRHVTDPVALEAIAQDIERLELGPGSQVQEAIDVVTSQVVMSSPVSEPSQSSMTQSEASGF